MALTIRSSVIVHIMALISLFSLSLFLLLPIHVAHAQYGVPGVENSVAITLTPIDPIPGSSVHLTAESALLDLSQSSLTWSVNGSVVKKGVGETSIDTTVGNVGSVTSVHVDVATINVTASADAVIRPTQIDLLFESDSYVPPFYKGRALPSAGTSLRLQALAYFIRKDGTEVPATQIDYTWKQNNQVVASASGRGKAAAVLPAPALYGTDTIEVDALSSDGSFSGSTSIVIPSIEPQVALYEDHPLFGIMYHNALAAQTSIPEAEMTFAAIPYFAQAQSANDPRLVYAWTVNGKDIPVDPKKTSELTIDARKSDGQAAIDLSITHTTNYFMSSSKSWGVSFSQGQGSAPGANDPFHQGQQ